LLKISREVTENLESHCDWKEEEDKMLKKIVLLYLEEGQTLAIAYKLATSLFKNRTIEQCQKRWGELSPLFKKEIKEAKLVGKTKVKSDVAWSFEEDQLLVQRVLEYLRNGRSLLEAFESLQEEFTHNEYACEIRFNRRVKNFYSKELTLAKKEGEALRKLWIEEAKMHQRTLLRQLNQLDQLENGKHTLLQLEELRIENELLSKRIARKRKAGYDMPKFLSREHASVL